MTARLALQILLLASLPQFLIAQGVATIGDGTEGPEENNVLVNAQVLKNGSPFQNVDVILKRKGQKLRQVKSGSDGFFTLYLEFDSVYTIAFEKDGYITKSVEVNTMKLPEEDKSIGYDVGMFKVSMTKPKEGMLVGIYKKPMARFVYDPRTQNFVVDRDYKKKRKEEFKRLEQREVEPIKF